MKKRMPVIFFGHGNPMNAIVQNNYTEEWSRIGKNIPRPKAILCVSAHWYLPFTAVTANLNPRTIHDFGGFPEALYQVQYPAPGSLDLARRVQSLLSPSPVKLDESWGLDHGTWSVLCRVFPEADIPVVQLSIDETKPPQFHYELGKKLAALRSEGVLIMGSGNVVHNLHTYAWGNHNVEPFEWALSFEGTVRRCLQSNDHETLINYEKLGKESLLAAPTPEHYLPLLYVIAAQDQDETVSFPIEGFDGGSISMLTIQIG